VPWDYVNNVEQITVPIVQKAVKYSVHVRATHLPQSGQTFALVVNGDFDVLDNNDCGNLIMCPANCGGVGRGKCGPTGICQCVDDFTGSDCSEMSNPIPKDDGDAHYFTTQGSVASGGWTYFHFDATDYHQKEGVSIIMKRISSIGDPDMYIEFQDFPSLKKYSFKSTGCDSCANAQDSVVTIAAGQVKVGRYRIGIQGYCCDGSDFSLKVVKAIPTPVVPTEGPKTVLIAGIIVVAIIAGVFLLQWWRRKRRIPAQGGYTLAGGPVDAPGRTYAQLGYMAPVLDASANNVGQVAVPVAQTGQVEPPRSGTHLPLPTEEPDTTAPK